MQPNIFEIGTKELHQDTFLTWLLQWGDPSNQQYNDALHKCGQAFIKWLIGMKYDNPASAITKVKSDRQWNYIDVWAEVHTEETKYFIIIEDKVHATVHGNQLKDYLDHCMSHCQQEGFLPVPIYLKTGNEPAHVLHSIRVQGYITVIRKDLLHFLESHKQVQNDIFDDFKKRLSKLESANQAFLTLPPQQWTGDCWIGFYQYLEEHLPWVKWHYVNPPNGEGFWNACLSWEQWQEYPVYVQIEQGPFCFKISTDPEDVDIPENTTPSQIRNAWYKILIEAAKQKGFTEIRKPDRFGTGKYMTVALIEQESWLGTSDQVIDLAQVVKRLHAYKQFLVSCIESCTQVEEEIS
jgi:hypothetical protein